MGMMAVTQVPLAAPGRRHTDRCALKSEDDTTIGPEAGTPRAPAAHLRFGPGKQVKKRAGAALRSVSANDNGARWMKSRFTARNVGHAHYGSSTAG
jgi:hypothetical protein